MFVLTLILAGCGPDRPACQLRWVTGAVNAGPLSVEVNRFEERRIGARPVTLRAPEGVTVQATITASGSDAITVLDEGGEPVALPWTGELPATFLLDASAIGDTTISAAVAGCEPVTLDARGVPVSPLAGRSRAEAPGFGYDTVFTEGAALEVALDGQPDGVEGDVYVVNHGAHDVLEDVTGAVEHLTLDALQGAVVWDAVGPPEGSFGARYDVVVDVDGDGAWSPGDRLDAGPNGLGLLVAGDLAVPGPHPTSQEDVTGGEWLFERVYWPDDLADLGPRPLVVISHGNGHEYTWYDYLGEHLASWGFVVMAHQNETMPGIETAATTTLTNTDWLLGNLETVGGGALVGLVDAARIGWMGHSRGGEGVVRAYARLHEGYTPVTYTAEDIGVILSIAPTVFYSVDTSDPGGVRYHLLAGSSDGDVTGSPEYAETQSFRLYQAATATRSSTYIYGASHEDFDCCGRDDGRGQEQLEREDVQTIAKAYVLAVMAEALDDDPVARALLSRDANVYPATTFQTPVLATWRPEDAVVIDNFQVEDGLAVASSGASVTTDLGVRVEDRLDDEDTELVYTGRDPMNGMTQAEDDADDARGLVLEWTHASVYAYGLTEGQRDWSGGGALALHACQVTRDPITETLAAPLDFSLTLVDGAGVSVTRAVRPYGQLPEPYRRPGAGDGSGWVNAFSLVRVPLVDFTTGATGLDLSDVRTVQLELGGEGDSPYGRIGLDDVEVVP